MYMIQYLILMSLLVVGLLITGSVMIFEDLNDKELTVFIILLAVKIILLSVGLYLKLSGKLIILTNSTSKDF